MAINYPTSLDAWTNPTGADTLATTPHSTHHGNHYDAIEALEGEVGTTTTKPAFGGAPQLNGFLWWSHDIDIAAGFGNTTTVVSGTLCLARVYFPKAMTVTNLHLNCTAAGTVTGCYGGLYTAAGAKLSQSASVHSGWTTGLRTFPLGVAQAVTANTAYYLAFHFVTSASPSFTIVNSAANTNINVVAPNLRHATADTGLTTTQPANFGAQAASTRTFWMAVS